MQYRTTSGAVGAAALVLIVAAACADTTAPIQPPEAPAAAALPAMARLLECPLSNGWSASVTVGPEGGSWGQRGVRVSVPAGAIPEPTTFTVALPASQYVEIRVTADGHSGYQFLKPVTIDIPYDRCDLETGLDGDLFVWYIDGETKLPLEFMGGINDRGRRTVRFQTDHLSGYAIAN
jgi:hypothetical protein